MSIPLIISGRSATIILETPPPGTHLWVSADTIVVSIMSSPTAVEVPTVDYSIIDGKIQVDLDITDTELLDTYVYGIRIQATWSAESFEDYSFPIFQIVTQSGIGPEPYASPEFAYNYASVRNPITITYQELLPYLIRASDIIDRLRYKDTPNEDQRRQFPRQDQTEVPDQIKEACVEIAIALIDGIDTTLEYENQSMTSQRYANVWSQYDRSTPNLHYIAGVPSLDAWRLLIPFLADHQSIDFR